MTALVLTTTTFTLERKKIFGSFFTATNELLLGFVDEKLTSFQYPLAFFASIPHYRSTPLREVSISMPEPEAINRNRSRFLEDVGCPLRKSSGMGRLMGLITICIY